MEKKKLGYLLPESIHLIDAMDKTALDRIKKMLLEDKPRILIIGHEHHPMDFLRHAWPVGLLPLLPKEKEAGRITGAFSSPYHDLIPVPLSSHSEYKQYRFPRSKKKRIRRKWASQFFNFRYIGVDFAHGEPAGVITKSHLSEDGQVRIIDEFDLQSASLGHGLRVVDQSVSLARGAYGLSADGKRITYPTERPDGSAIQPGDTFKFE